MPGRGRRLAAHAAAASCYAILPGNVELQTFETQFSFEILQTGLIDHDGEWLERGESAPHCTDWARAGNHLKPVWFLFKFSGKVGCCREPLSSLLLRSDLLILINYES